MLEKYKIKLHLIILSTNISHNKKYILSTTSDDINIPHIYLNDNILTDLETNIIKQAQEYVFTSELELLPQLITLNSKYIESAPGELNAVYGFVINKTDNINNSYWIEFDYLASNKYSNIIFETVQKLK